jgi:hypothetical protein
MKFNVLMATLAIAYMTTPAMAHAATVTVHGSGLGDVCPPEQPCTCPNVGGAVYVELDGTNRYARTLQGIDPNGVYVFLGVPVGKFDVIMGDQLKYVCHNGMKQFLYYCLWSNVNQGTVPNPDANVPITIPPLYFSGCTFISN